MTNQEKSVNAVTLSGLLQDAIVRYTGSGDPVANCTLLVVEGKPDKPRKQFLRMVAWKGLASKAAELPKDSKVRVTGRIETVSWQDKTSGEKKYRVQVVADSLEPIQSLTEIPAPKAPKEKTSSRIGGTEVAAAILRPHSSAITSANPITDDDIPF